MTCLRFAIIHHFKFVGDEKTRPFLVSLVIQLLYVLSTRLEYECSYEAMGQLAILNCTVVTIFFLSKPFVFLYLRLIWITRDICLL